MLFLACPTKQCADMKKGYPLLISVCAREIPVYLPSHLDRAPPPPVPIPPLMVEIRRRQRFMQRKYSVCLVRRRWEKNTLEAKFPPPKKNTQVPKSVLNTAKPSLYTCTLFLRISMCFVFVQYTLVFVGAYCCTCMELPKVSFPLYLIHTIDKCAQKICKINW